MSITIIPACHAPKEVGILFSEYTDMLISGDSSFQEYLDIQHYDEEIEHLEIKYGAPGGRLYLAYCDGEPAGCIALRKIDRKPADFKNHNRCKGNRLFPHAVGHTSFFKKCDSPLQEIWFL